METTLQHFNQYSSDSPMYWPGLTSNRFPKMRLMHPRRDIIHSGTTIFIQVSIYQTMFHSQAENTTLLTILLNISSNPDSDNTKISNIGVLNQQESVLSMLTLPNLIFDMKKSTIEIQSLSMMTRPSESRLFTTGV